MTVPPYSAHRLDNRLAGPSPPFRTKSLRTVLLVDVGNARGVTALRVADIAAILELHHGLFSRAVASQGE